MENRGVRPLSSKRAYLEGYRLVFNKLAKSGCGRGFANIVPDANSRVEGILYSVTEDALQILDQYEGVKDGHYHRSTQLEIIPCEDETPVIAAVYIACEGKTREGLKPTREYLNHLLAGSVSAEYRDFLNSFETAN